MTVFYKLQKTTGGLPINSKMKVMPVRQIAVDFESLAQKISVGTTFSSADLIGALDALKEAMIVELKEGGRVHLPGFGYFSLSIKGEVYQDAKTQRYRLRSPRIRKIKFLPERTLMKRLADTHFANVGSTSPTSKPLSDKRDGNRQCIAFIVCPTASIDSGAASRLPSFASHIRLSFGKKLRDERKNSQYWLGAS